MNRKKFIGLFSSALLGLPAGISAAGKRFNTFLKPNAFQNPHFPDNNPESARPESGSDSGKKRLLIVPAFSAYPSGPTQELLALRKGIMRPQTVIFISPHWVSNEIMVGTTNTPVPMHWLGPKEGEYAQNNYSPAADRPLADKLLEALNPLNALPDAHRGPDYHCGMAMQTLFPDAALAEPVALVQISLKANMRISECRQFAEILSKVQKNEMIIISLGAIGCNKEAVTQAVLLHEAIRCFIDFEPGA